MHLREETKKWRGRDGVHELRYVRFAVTNVAALVHLPLGPFTEQLQLLEAAPHVIVSWFDNMGGLYAIWGEKSRQCGVA